MVIINSEVEKPKLGWQEYKYLAVRPF